MTRWNDAKIRSGDTWDEVRRGWEAGETAASLARRYDVGLANLWRRRASEGWEQRSKADPAPEPLEGWDRYAERQRDLFEGRLAAARELAQDLMAAMQGGPVDEAPLWHLGFILTWGAEHLGPEVAAADRERAKDQPWAEAVWDEAGRLRRPAAQDMAMMRLHRATWREEVGLPEGAAEWAP